MRPVELLRSCSPLTRWLAIFALANITIVSLVLVALPGTGVREVAPYHAALFLAFRSSDDSWRPIAEAWTYLQSPGDATVYQVIFFDGGTKFQYALTSLLPIEALMLVHSGDVVPYGPLEVASWIAMWATAILVVLIFHHSVKKYAPQYAPTSLFEKLLVSVTVLCMTLTFYPLAKGAALGQVQTWISALFALLVWLWISDRRVPAGMVGGLICAIKPQLGLLLVWGALRRQWGFSAAFAFVLGTLGLVTLALYGLEDNLDYFHVLRYISRHGESYYANQSINGLLNRLYDNGSNRDFEVNAFPPYRGPVYFGTLLTSTAILGFAFFWRSSEHGRSSGFDLMIGSLSFTIASPVAWEHHYGILMPIYAMMLPAMLRWPVFGPWTLPLLGGSYLLSSNFFHVAQEAAGTPLLTPLQSYLLVSAFFVLVSLYLLRHEEASSAGDVEPNPQGSGRSDQQPAKGVAPSASGATSS